MSPRPGTVTAPSRRPWLAAVGVGLFAVALVGYLIHGFYTGRQAQYRALEQDELAHTQALGVSLDHFLSGLQSEVAELADRREISAWFENAALGMTLEYGLRINLLDLEMEFDKRLGRRLPGGQPIFARMVLLDADGRVVLDSRDPRRDPGAAFDEDWTRPTLSGAGPLPVQAGYLSTARQVLLAAECRVLDRHEGWLLAFVPATTLRVQVQGASRATDTRLCLSWDGRALGDTAEASPPPPGTTRLVNDAPPRLLSSTRTPHFPLTITRVSPINGALATDPRVLVWGLAALAVMMLGLSVLVWRGQLRAQSLFAHLDAEAEHARDLAVRQRELEGEIERRLQVEADLVQARDAAEAASRAKSQFLANMSHEFRTPLNGVLGMTELVLGTPLDDGQREQLETALESGRALLTVINDIMDMSSLEVGAMRLDPIPFEPRVELESIRRAFLAGAHQRELALTWDLDPALATSVCGDPVRLRQVLVNLLGNALKFTERGSVSLAVRVDSAADARQVVEFRVSDTGIGIAPDKQALIFEAFQQVDGSHTRRYGGTGLGLHLSRRLVAMMGGELVVDSRVGAGSCFRFRLDLPVVAAVAPEPASLPPTAVGTASWRLLVAAANPVNRKLLSSLLQKWGHEVTLTATGDEALAALRAGVFDAALLDLQLPGIDGLEVARRCRGHERAIGGARLPLIALTASVPTENMDSCGAAGFDAHLPGPLNSRVLWKILEDAVPTAVSCPGCAGTVPAPR
jgi:signal transduction histidine kinase